MNIRRFFERIFNGEDEVRKTSAIKLGISLIFIAFVVVYIRTTPVPERADINKPIDNNPISTESPVPTESPEPAKKPDKVTKSEINYSYVYTVNFNGNKEVFTGKKVDEKEVFTLINSTGSVDYAILSGNYLIRKPDGYSLVDAPSEFMNYINMDNIIELSEKGESTRDNEHYIFSIKVSDEVEMFMENQEIMVPNELVDIMDVTVDENGNVKTVNYNLNNYCVQAFGSGTLTISMEFNNLGTTKDFDITLSN